MLRLFDLPLGKRLVMCGTTGCGKTTLACRYLQNSGDHWAIFNPKGTRGYNVLRPKIITEISESAVYRAIEKEKYTSLNFSPRWSRQYQDDLLLRITERFENIGICIDELYHLHSNGVAGTGLNGLLTRGRELKQTFLGLTQRPIFVSKFVFSEADAVIEFALRYHDDRRRMVEYTGREEALRHMDGHDFMYFDMSTSHAKVTTFRQPTRQAS